MTHLANDDMTPQANVAELLKCKRPLSKRIKLPPNPQFTFVDEHPIFDDKYNTRGNV